MTGSGRIARWADNKVYLPLARFAERHARIKLWFGLAGAVGGAFAFAALERVLNNLGTDWGTFEVHPEVMVKAAGVGLIGGGATALNYTRRFINRVELALKRDADQKNKKFVEENARLNGIIMKLTTEQRTIMGQTPQAQKPVGALLGGRYELVEKLGEGGMAFTYKIRDTKMTNRLIVYKVPRPDVFQFPKERERFEKAEAEAMEQLHHPGIVRFIGLEDMSHEDYKKLTGISLEGWPNIPSQIPYIVMEYISAPTLDRELIQSGGQFPLTRALKFTVGLAETLEFVRRKGVIHRDLKPSNIFIVKDEINPDEKKTKIGDFGLARIKEGSNLTQMESTMGTPAYMSPDQLKSLKDVDWRADQYAVGAIFCEMLSGEPPFGKFQEGESVSAYGLRVMTEPLPDFSSKISSEKKVADKVNVVLQRMLAKDREQRYKTWEECIKDLKEILNIMEGLVPGQPAVPRTQIGPCVPTPPGKK